MKKKFLFKSLLIFIVLCIIYEYNYQKKNTPSSVDYSMADSVINSQIKDSMTDYDKIKAIHDYLVINTQYDTEAVNSGNIPEIDYTAKGVFINHLAVCRGYAEAFQIIMNRLDIPSKIVTGYSNSISHAWNVVEINNKWYHIDCTFDDPVINAANTISSIANSLYETSANEVRYDYFLVDDNQIKLDHTINSDSPICSSDDYMYNNKISDVPYTVLDSVYSLPASYASFYKNNNATVTIYYPENIDLSSSGIVKQIGYTLNSTGYNITSCTYTPSRKCGNYYYTTISTK